MINIGAGLIASIIILLFSTSKERNIVYYNDIIPLLENRCEILSKAYYFDFHRKSIAVQNGDYDTFLDCHRRMINTLCFIRSFYKMVCDTAAFKPKYLFKIYNELDQDFSNNSKFSTKVHDSYNARQGKSLTILCDELRTLDEEQFRNERICERLLYILEKYIADLKSQLYTIKYSKRRLTPKMKDLEKRESEMKKTI